jgi:L-fuconolactonase
MFAAHENVCCKLSGLLTEASSPWTDAALMPYAEQVIAAFGRGRLLYGSDWPVLTLAGTHADWYAFTRRATASWSDAERDAFYGGNAARVYGLRDD